jgi:hypothetical protein
VSTAALFSFLGFPASPCPHLLLPHDGFPTGAAWRLAQARRGCALPAALPASFLASQPAACPLADPGEAGAVALYRYELVLHPRRACPLWIACWRRYPGGIGWQRRCGPMALNTFLGRYLPGDGPPAAPG